MFLHLAGNRFIYGNALFLGWLACGLGIVGAVVQICGTTGDDDDDDYRKVFQKVFIALTQITHVFSTGMTEVAL